MKFVTYFNVRQGHEVFGDVNNKLVNESRGNVETIHVTMLLSKLYLNYVIITNSLLKQSYFKIPLFFVERTEREKDEQKLI